MLDASKQFFFENKNRKTFAPVGVRCGGVSFQLPATALTKVFCFFSSEKKALL